MGFGLLAAIVLASGSASAGYRSDNWFWRSYDQKWCLSAATELYECGYATFQQCMTARSGVGGSCNVNPYYVERAPQAPAKRRVHR
jgi:hypothetical protein